MDRYVITGPTGWVGQALLQELAATCGEDLPHRVRLFGSSAREIMLADGQALQVAPLEDLTPEDTRGAHVVHLAYLTKEKADLLGADSFVAVNTAIDDRVIAAMTLGPPESLFVSSSGAAAAAASGQDRHPYGTCKLEQERRFLSLADALDVPAVVGRIYALSGPYINKVRSYAISNMLMQARDTGVIRVEARLPVFRSYLSVRDLARIIFASAHQRVSRPAAIDLCGGEIVEIGDLAEAIAAHGDSPVRIERGAIDYTHASVYLGNFVDTRVLAMQTKICLTSLAVQICETRDWLSGTVRYEA